MKADISSTMISARRWTTVLVVFSEALHLAVSLTGIRHLAHCGLSDWMLRELVCSEGAAALLFLLPATTVVGGYWLFFIFVFAPAVHCHGHDFGVGTLLVYSMGVRVAITHTNDTLGGRKND